MLFPHGVRLGLTPIIHQSDVFLWQQEKGRMERAKLGVGHVWGNQLHLKSLPGSRAISIP